MNLPAPEIILVNPFNPVSPPNSTSPKYPRNPRKKSTLHKPYKPHPRTNEKPGNLQAPCLLRGRMCTLCLHRRQRLQSAPAQSGCRAASNVEPYALNFPRPPKTRKAHLKFTLLGSGFGGLSFELGRPELYTLYTAGCGLGVRELDRFRRVALQPFHVF